VNIPVTMNDWLKFFVDLSPQVQTCELTQPAFGHLRFALRIGEGVEPKSRLLARAQELAEQVAPYVFLIEVVDANPALPKYKGDCPCGIRARDCEYHR
jgi:hypothetical protein